MRLFVLLFVLAMCISLSAQQRAVDIEDFESGDVTLYSWIEEDLEPDSWELSNLNTYAESDYSLRIWGNTWKGMDIAPVEILADAVWSIACYVENAGEIHGFGLSDGQHTLYYALDGSEELDVNVWVTADQGYYPTDDWFVYQLPVGQDFLARFDYLPTVNAIVFINDNDSGSGETFFDLVQDITDDLPVAPVVTATADIEPVRRHSGGLRTVEVQFDCEVTDPDSDTLYYYWQFGDGASSDEPSPVHTYTVEDDHAYTAMLRVCDETGHWGYASCVVPVDEGDGSLPLTINFVGDIMMARNMEWLINSGGVESLFDPILDMLSDADLTVANLECPLTTYNYHHPTKSIYFKGSPAYVDGLVYGGVDMVSLANNHTMDYMGPGLEQTREALQGAGVLYGGAGLNSYEAYLPAWWVEKGLSVAFCFSSDRTGQYNNYQPYLNAGFDTPGFANLTPWYALQQIEAVQDAADATVMCWHTGSEYSTEPGNNYDYIPNPDLVDPMGDEDYSPLIDVPQMWDRQLRQYAIDNGADAVICHHPHIMQGVEVYEGKLIAHSLGDFVFDLYYPETMPTYILQGELGEEGFERWTLRPVFIDDYVPRPATGEMGRYILDWTAMRSRELDTVVRVFPDEMYADVPLDPASIDPYFYTVRKTVDLEPRGDWAMSEPTKLARLGSISAVDDAHQPEGVEVRLGREMLWWGNMENEGCTLWNLNSSYEDYDAEEAARGARSIKHEGWTGSDGITTNQESRLKIYGDSLAFTLQGCIKTENSEMATVRIRYYQYRTGGSYLDEQNIGVELSGANAWDFYWHELSIPVDAEFYDPFLYSEFSDEQPGPNWYDDINLVQWTDWTPLDELDEIAYPNDYYWMQVRAPNSELESLRLVYTETAWSGYVVPNDDNDVPAPAAVLHRNYPNPFNPETTIRYSLPEDSDVTLSVYNVRGQRVARLVNERQTAGDHNVVWRADGHASGVYFYRLEAGTSTLTRKMLLVK